MQVAGRVDDEPADRLTRKHQLLVALALPKHRRRWIARDATLKETNRNRDYNRIYEFNDADILVMIKTLSLTKLT